MAFPGFKLRVANDGKSKGEQPDESIAEKDKVEKPDVAAEQIAGPQDSQANRQDESGASDAPQDRSGKPVQKEIGGPQGPEPTRFGDWEKNGRCYDF